VETSVVDAPEVRYAKSGDVNIAYGVVGDGPFDLVFIVGAVFTTLEHAWEGPPAEFFSRLASFCRLISGIAVHVGSRIVAEAAAGEVLVSSTVKDIVAGSGIASASAERPS
jgi:hypothetical protein